MRLNKLNIDKKTADSIGIETNLMDKLGSLVALIGKNGSGKTRVLGLIENFVSQLTIDKIREGYLELLPKGFYTDLGLKPDEISKLNYIKYNSEDDSGPIRVADPNFKLFKDNLLKNRIVRINPDDLMNVKIDELEDVINFEMVIKDDQMDKNFDSVALTKSGILFFKSLSSKFVREEFNAFVKRDNAEDEPNHILFRRFNQILKNMIGSELKIENDSDSNSDKIRGVITFGGRPFNYDQLSPGQRILFSYCLYFFILDLNPEFNLKDSIIIIDEPEKHLHPEAQIQLIRGVHSVIEKEGQLWIATHSVHILGYLHPDQIFYLENGHIQPPGKMTPAKALDALLGYTYNKDELTSLLLATSDWTFSKFITDCLINPEVIIKTNKNDPQFLQFYQHIKSMSFENILDFGAGHGRLEKTLEEVGTVFPFKVDAFEPDKIFFKELTSIKTINNVISKKEDIKGDYYDLVILSNVLHEIEPENWKSTLESIMKSLKYKGQLMILEDLVLPKGEAPNDIGYLVLGKNEIKALFEISGEILSIEPKDEKYKGRIICTVIPRDMILHLSIYSIEKAIKLLKERCISEIKMIRKSKDVTLGKKLGFYNQQYINCELALESLNNNKYSFR